MEDAPQNDPINDPKIQPAKPKFKPVDAVHIKEDDMSDDESEQIMAPKKISLVKQRKESVDNNHQDTINIKLLEANNIKHIGNNDLKNMNFEEA